MSKTIVDFIGVSIEMLILFVFFFSIFPEKKIDIRIIGTSIVTYILVYTLSYLPLGLVLRVLLVWCVVFIFSMPFPCEILRKILLSFFPVSINCCMEILAGAIQIVFFDSVQLIVNNELVQYSQGVFLSKALSVLFFLFLVKSGCVYLKTISKTILGASVFILCVSTILVYQLFPLLLLSTDPYLHYEFLFLCSAITCINIILFYIIFDINRKEQTNLEYIHIVNTQKAQELLSRELARKQEETNMLIHDIHNKLLSLSAYAQRQDYTKILESIEYLDEELLANKFILTRYPELDALLYSKINKAKLSGIILTPLISDFSTTIDIFDLNTIIGNLLDNAIEGCQPNPINNKKTINFSIKTKGNLLIIIVENTIPQMINIKDNQLIPTTKSDKKLHGIGLKSIKYFVKKYDGSFELSSSPNKFTATVILPLITP